MTTCGKQEKFSFPGFARSIVRPVVRTTSSVVKRGEKVVGNVTGMALKTAKDTVYGTGKIAKGVVSDGTKVVGDVAGLATHTVKNTISGTSKVVSNVVRGSTKVVKNVAGVKSTRKTKKQHKK